MITISKYRNHEKVAELEVTKNFSFPGGEVGISINERNHKFFEVDGELVIRASLTSSDDFMKLVMVTDALRIINPNQNISLFVPYFAYARQDRVCNPGESFSVKAFANLINSLNYYRVYICDPHSDVTPSVLDRVKVFTQFDVVNNWIEFTNRARPGILIAPDAGANKKTSTIAKYFMHDKFIRADKLRELSTGKIIETVVYCDDFKGRDVICLDDIGDGMKTFTELARACKAKNCGKFVVYVTHGIFSKGVDICFENQIDELWTTDSFNTEFDKRVNVFRLDRFLLNIR